MRPCLFALSAAILALSVTPAFAQTAAPASTAPAAPAQAAPARPSLMDRAVNTVNVSGWNVYGPNQTTQIVDSSVQGGKAVRVNVTAAGANPWDVGAGSTSVKAIAPGDVLLLAVWLRAERLPAGATSAKLNIGMQQSTAPYAGIGTAAIEVGTDWKLYFLQADAAQAYAPGGATASVHLAIAPQTIDLGPAFLLDFGPGYDKSLLPNS